MNFPFKDAADRFSMRESEFQRAGQHEESAFKAGYWVFMYICSALNLADIGFSAGGSELFKCNIYISGSSSFHIQ